MALKQIKISGQCMQLYPSTCITFIFTEVSTRLNTLETHCHR